MMKELSAALDLATGAHGLGPAITAWTSFSILFCRLVVKPFNIRMQNTMTEALAAAAKDPEDAQWWHEKVLTRTWYRLGAFFVDAFFSIKLPSHADFHALVAENKTGQVTEPGIKSGS